MEDFRVALDECNLANLGFHGYKFIWNNKRLGIANARERLDRIVANREWKEKFSVIFMNNLFSHASDHLPLLLQFEPDRRFKGRVAWGFKFEEA